MMFGIFKSPIYKQIDELHIKVLSLVFTRGIKFISRAWKTKAEEIVISAKVEVQ